MLKHLEMNNVDKLFRFVVIAVRAYNGIIISEFSRLPFSFLITMKPGKIRKMEEKNTHK